MTRAGLAVLLALLGASALAQGDPSPDDRSPDDPSLCLNLAGISDWSTQVPFLDLLRTSRPWVAHSDAQWGAWQNADLRAGGYLTEEGWPAAMPDGARAMETLVLTDLPEDTGGVAGAYLLRWDGPATIDVVGRAADVTRPAERTIRFTYAPGDGPVAIAVTELDGPIRSMTLVREDRAAALDAGAMFNPDWLARIDPVRAVRVMDWMDTNGSEQVTWADRPEVGDATWADRGVPVEVLARLANETGADLWVTLPHMADDDYVRRFAGALDAALDPRRRIYAEWSNEVWNWMFAQARWAEDRARATGAPDWMAAAGARAGEVARIWSATLPDERVTTVAGVQTGWPGLEQGFLDAAGPGAFEALAVTGYIGLPLDRPDVPAPGDAAWRDWALTGARAAADQLADEWWPHFTAVARDRGLELLAYEGGPHLVGLGPQTEDDALTARLVELSYSDEIAALQSEVIADFRDAGGTLFCAFVDVAPPSRWGSWGALRHLGDDTARWRGLMEANARPAGWESRGPGAFQGQAP